MAETLSPHYSWVKPDIGGDASTWGNVLNQTTDAIDSVVYANQQAGVPIGSITMWAGPNVKTPANWMLCAGQVLSTTTYATLFGVIGYLYGGSGATFNLPNLLSKFPMGSGDGEHPGSTGGNSSVPIAVGNLPAHNHPASQDAHNHGITTGNHSHTLSTGPHAHVVHTGAHAHSGVVVSGGTFSLGQPGWSTQPGNTSTVGDLGGNTDTVGNLGGATDTAGNLGGSTDARQPNVYTGNTGSGTPLSIAPPYLTINFIIRYQ